MNFSAPAQFAQVHYRADVLDARGRVVRALPRKKNLILDAGLDGIVGRAWVDAFTHAVIGTGTTPTKRDSGAVTVSRAGNVLTASAGFFEAADVGRLFKFDSGEEVRVTAYASATSVTTATSGAIAAAEGTMWYVNQTGLDAETKRTNTYANDAGSNGSTYAAGVWTHKRTFLFAAETGTVTYREIGWSHTVAAGANLFGRDLLAGVGATLVSGQQLRVVVELSVAFFPVVPTAYANVVTGWTSNGSCGIEQISDAAAFGTNGSVATVAAAGASQGTATACLEPFGPGAAGVSTETLAIRAASTGDVGSISTITRKNFVLGSYASGTFTRKKTASFTVSEGNSAAIRSLTLHASSGASRPVYRILLDSPETKTSSQTLSLEFAWTWGRVLSNA